MLPPHWARAPHIALRLGWPRWSVRWQGAVRRRPEATWTERGYLARCCGAAWPHEAHEPPHDWSGLTPTGRVLAPHHRRCAFCPHFFISTSLNCWRPTANSRLGQSTRRYSAAARGILALHECYRCLLRGGCDTVYLLSTPLGHKVGHIALRARNSARACSRASGSSII